MLPVRNLGTPHFFLSFETQTISIQWTHWNGTKVSTEVSEVKKKKIMCLSELYNKVLFGEQETVKCVTIWIFSEKVVFCYKNGKKNATKSGKVTDHRDT